jgi:hypothetical protein
VSAACGCVESHLLTEIVSGANSETAVKSNNLRPTESRLNCNQIETHQPTCTSQCSSIAAQSKRMEGDWYEVHSEGIRVQSAC